jgi:hypothetical protein
VFSDILRAPSRRRRRADEPATLSALGSLRADGAVVHYDSTVSEVVGKISLD